MPKVTKTRVGSVFLKEERAGKWRASWTDPPTRRHLRRILPAASYTEALEQAKEINRQLALGKGFAGRLRGSAGHSVSDAVLEAVRHTAANDQSRKNYLSRFNAFVDYLLKHARGVQAWSDVTEPILENFMEYCRREGRSYDTIRQRLLVLRITSSYMSRTYPDQYRHVAVGLRLTTPSIK